jgi:hypothetical protein
VLYKHINSAVLQAAEDINFFDGKWGMVVVGEWYLVERNMAGGLGRDVVSESCR